MCNSFKSKKSTERCPHKSLMGLQFCGKHAKVKNPLRWKESLNETKSVILIQKMWRGWMIRNFLKLAGSGVLKRTGCHNDEELVTFETKDRQYPLDYFSFEENGKLWWFSLETAIKLCQQEVPSNPYTKEKINEESRKRIHEMMDLCAFRKMIKLVETTHEKSILLSQILEENLFEHVSFKYFEYMSRIQLIIFTQSLQPKFEVRANSVQRRKHLFIIQSCVTRQFNMTVEHEFLIFQLLSSLLYILRSVKNKFPICFIILEALYTI